MIYKVKHNGHIDLSKIIQIGEVSINHSSCGFKYGFTITFQLLDKEIFIRVPEPKNLEYKTEDIEDRRHEYENAWQKDAEKLRDEVLNEWRKLKNFE